MGRDRAVDGKTICVGRCAARPRTARRRPDQWRVEQRQRAQRRLGIDLRRRATATMPWTRRDRARRDDGETVVWGTDDGETVVWGTDDGETVVWGTVVHGLRAARRSSGAAGDDIERLACSAAERAARVGRDVEARSSWSGAVERPPRFYVLAVMAAGAVATVAWFPTQHHAPVAVLRCCSLTSCLTSLWKLNLPIPLASGSTLSVSYAAEPDGAPAARAAARARHCARRRVDAVHGQRSSRRYPWYRTAFSIAGEALTMVATGVVYRLLGGPLRPVEFAEPRQAARRRDRHVLLRQHRARSPAPIAPTSDRSVWEVWLDDFSWSGASFMVAGTAGAAAAVVIARGEHWTAVLMIAPVYLTYKTYQVFIGRLEDRDRHAAEARRLHQETTDALSLAQQAEHALAAEKDRLAATVAELTRLEARASGAARARARRARSRGGRQPAEGSVPRDGLARAAHAAQRHPRLGGHAAHADDRRGACAIAPADRSTTTRGSRRG